jgi:hypothetical protein
MTSATVTKVDAAPTGDDAPPPGTAIIRPLNHVRAIRNHLAGQSAGPGQHLGSAPDLAWAWALGETATAPVTGQQTAMPPRLADIEAELAAADGHSLRDDPDGGVGDAAVILRWLIGADDHLPIPDKNRGDLVGGLGGVIRPMHQLAALLADTRGRHEMVFRQSRNLNASTESRLSAQQDADYFDGVTVTLAWVLSQPYETPVTRQRSADLTSRALKTERLHARDVIEQGDMPWLAGRVAPGWYGEGVKRTIDWLLGDTTSHPDAR